MILIFYYTEMTQAGDMDVSKVQHRYEDLGSDL